jgi:hypothetical protein
MIERHRWAAPLRDAACAHSVSGDYLRFGSAPVETT